MPAEQASSEWRRGLRSGQSERDVETELVERAATGDEGAFAVLVERHLGRVLAVGRRMLGDDAEAEDVAQETFYRFWRNADRFDPQRAQLSTWLYRVASNLCIDRLRGRRVEPLDEIPEIESDPEQERTMDEQDLSARMDTALRLLPDRQRLALTLFHYQELSMKEAADIMEVTIDAFESLLARARRGVKKNLETEWKMLLPDNG